MKKTVISITGIRPDFIRMAEIFNKLDDNFNHILIHTGQHYDKLLSNVFFDELNIRKPNYILNTGNESTNHYEQLSYLTLNIPKLLKENNIEPDLIIFLGDSNTTGVSFPLKKAGYKICHIEAGMRSFDKRMLEEINRRICDHCSDILFVYHNDYKRFLQRENIIKNVYVVGNTIVEVANRYKKKIMSNEKTNDMILMDIHRPENFNDKTRLENIIEFGNLCYHKYNLPIKILYFNGLKNNLIKYDINLGNIEMIDLLPYNKYLNLIYNSKFIISDSGTGQEEPSLFNTKVLVPREYTEREQSYENNCSYKLNVNNNNKNYKECFEWLENDFEIKTEWLGNGETSQLIINHLLDYFKI